MLLTELLKQGFLSCKGKGWTLEWAQRCACRLL